VPILPCATQSSDTSIGLYGDRPRASLEEKLRVAFSLFDANGSGRIDAPELFQLLRLMTGRVHDDKDLQAITDGCAQFKNRTYK